jgi:hypothetical protein
MDLRRLRSRSAPPTAPTRALASPAHRLWNLQDTASHHNCAQELHCGCVPRTAGIERTHCDAQDAVGGGGDVAHGPAARASTPHDGADSAPGEGAGGVCSAAAQISSSSGGQQPPVGAEEVALFAAPGRLGERTERPLQLVKRRQGGVKGVGGGDGPALRKYASSCLAASAP